MLVILEGFSLRKYHLMCISKVYKGFKKYISFFGAFVNITQFTIFIFIYAVFILYLTISIANLYMIPIFFLLFFTPVAFVRLYSYYKFEKPLKKPKPLFS